MENKFYSQTEKDWFTGFSSFKFNNESNSWHVFFVICKLGLLKIIFIHHSSERVDINAQGTECFLCILFHLHNHTRGWNSDDSAVMLLQRRTLSRTTASDNIVNGTWKCIVLYMLESEGGKKHNPRKVCRGKVLSRVPLFLLFSYPQTALWLFPSVSISGRPAMCLVASEPHEMVTSTLIRTGRALPFQQGRRPGRSVYRMPPAKEKPHSRL